MILYYTKLKLKPLKKQSKILGKYIKEKIGHGLKAYLCISI